jgi:lysophospholipase L1-like esterase
MKKLLANGALLLIALAFSFGVCEVVVRLLYEDATVLFPRYHTDYQYGPYRLRGIRPNARFWHHSPDGSWRFATNGRGFRSEREFAYAKPPGTVRVLSLGDSHTQGYEVRQEATFSAVLERALARRGVGAEVINAGVSGFSNAEELAFLEHEGFKYQPDAVVLGFYANDFSDNLKAALFSLDADGRLVADKFDHLPGVRIQNVIYALPPVRWLSENSYLYSLLFNNVWNYFKDRLARQAARQADAKEPSQAAADAFEYAVAHSSNHSAYEVALAAALVERMHALCRERGIPFIVVDIPTRPGRYRFASSVPEPMGKRLEAAGVELMRSDPLFARLAGAELHVPRGHSHISELAHAVIAGALAERLGGLDPGGARCQGEECARY